MPHEVSTKKVQVGGACLALFLSALFLTAYSSKNPTVARIGATVVLRCVSPLLQLSQAVTGGAADIWHGYISLVSAARENAALKIRLGSLEAKVIALSEAERENDRLRTLINFSRERGVVGITAAVIGGDPSGWVKGVVVDKGAAQGVVAGMAVIHPEGVVGQVVAVSKDSARVLLVSDHSSGVDVMVQSTRARGVLEGAGERVCELKFITRDQPVKVGEKVITSGMDGVYPKGILVGEVFRVSSGGAGLFQNIEVKQAVDLAGLEEVLLVGS
jgi:rod shape-determining protein MreC